MVRLGEVATYINGYAFKPSDWATEGIPIIRIQDLTGSAYKTNFYNGEIAEKYKVVAGDVLISWSASLGVFVWDKQDAVLNQHIFKVVFDKVDVDKRFFIHQAKSILERAESETHGATMKHLTKPVFDALEFYLPSKNVQCEIAKIFDKIDKMIVLRNQQLQKLDELIKARFVEMFGNPEVNEFNWDEAMLVEHLDVIGGYAFKSDSFLDNGIPVLRIGNINTGEFIPVNLVFWKKDEALKRYRILPGDLVMSLTGTVGKDDYGNVCILDDTYPEYYLNQRNAKLSLKKSLNKHYLSEILRFEQIKRKLTGISRGVRQANISNKDILELTIPVPPVELQNQFADFVQQIDKSKLHVQKSLEKLETLKKALMQKYFG